jgi:uncharacterized protein (TIGR00730 family)
MSLPEEPQTFYAQTGHQQPDRAQKEIAEAYQAVEGLGPAVSIFGSARTDRKHAYYKLARETGKILGDAGYGVITGGGPGIMEAANRGAKEAGAPSVGLHITLPNEQAINKYVDLPLVFKYFFCRKIFYVDPAQAFVVLPGGSGTLDELFEVLTLIKTAKIPAYPVVLAPSSYWQGLFEWLKDTALADYNIDAADLRMLRMADTPEEILAHVQSVKKARKRSIKPKN